MLKRDDVTAKYLRFLRKLEARIAILFRASQSRSFHVFHDFHGVKFYLRSEFFSYLLDHRDLIFCRFAAGIDDLMLRSKKRRLEKSSCFCRPF